jgi:ABC-2 type transport system permease protein
MICILKKEIYQLYSSAIGFIIMSVFIVVSGLFLWVFRDTSILSGNVASLEQLFFMAPYLFLFLIPSITMGSISEEFQSGTTEIVFTKPITTGQFITGKYLAYILLLLFLVLLSLTHYYSLNQLSSPQGNIDHGSIIGSYAGMFLLGCGFTAIGIFGSSLARSQVAAFIISLLLCFLSYWGFYYISRLSLFNGGPDAFIEKVGMEYHYLSLSRGVIVGGDVGYFLFVILLFLSLSHITLTRRIS